MDTTQVQDPIYNVLARAEASLGAVGLGFALVVLFFGVATSLAWWEKDSEHYHDVRNVPYFKNYSTLIDFAILDPLLIVLMVRSTKYMLALPGILRPSVAMSPQVFATKAAVFASRIGSWVPCAALLTAAAVAWVVYWRSLGSKGEAKKRHRPSASGTYVGVVTVGLMYLILTYFYRAVVSGIFVLEATTEGFRLDELMWNYGTRSVGRFQYGFGWVAGVLAAIVVVFAVHDLLLYRRGRRMRVVAGSALLAGVTLFVFLGSLVGVHDNLVSVLDAVSLGLASAASSGDKTAALSLARVAQLPRWTLQFTDVVGMVSSQAIAVGATVLPGDAVKVARGLISPKSA